VLKTPDDLQDAVNRAAAFEQRSMRLTAERVERYATMATGETSAIELDEAAAPRVAAS
jgi:hypothetical protein